MQENNLKIKGRVYKYEVKTTKNGKTLCRFGLQFYNGKDKDGKSMYAFLNCKGFNDYNLKEKQDIVLYGNIACEEWTDKQGVKRSSLLVLVNRIEAEEKKEVKIDDNEFPF